MILSLDHIQFALPKGAEPRMRAFYLDLLGMVEVAKPIALQGRGGFWARAGTIDVHFGVDPQFAPATKAHPAFWVCDLDVMATRLKDAQHDVRWATGLPGIRRFFTSDPVGNRVELIAAQTR